MVVRMEGILFVLLAIFAGSTSADICPYTDEYGVRQYLTCPGLPNDHDEKYCCETSSLIYCCSKGASSVGATVGIIIGIIVLTSIVIISVCCCVASCPLYRGRRNQGTVITATTVNPVVMQSPAPQYPPPPPAYPYPDPTTEEGYRY